jgi:hypothetical protein
LPVADLTPPEPNADPADRDRHEPLGKAEQNDAGRDQIGVLISGDLAEAQS